MLYIGGASAGILHDNHNRVLPCNLFDRRRTAAFDRREFEQRPVLQAVVKQRRVVHGVAAPAVATPQHLVVAEDGTGQYKVLLRPRSVAERSCGRVRAERSSLTDEDKRGGSFRAVAALLGQGDICLLYTSPSPRDGLLSRMPSSA